MTLISRLIWLDWN